MNLKALIATLVLGSSSVALAAPSVTVSATVRGGHSTTVVRDRGYESPPIMRPTPTTPPIAVYSPPTSLPPVVVHSPPIMRPGHWRPAPIARPVTLASNLSFAHDGRKFITVGAQAGRFGKLELNGAGGRTFIKQIYVEFDNGQEQVVRDLDRTLTANERLTIDLDGNRRAIRRIVVYGTNLNKGFRHKANAFHVTAS